MEQLFRINFTKSPPSFEMKSKRRAVGVWYHMTETQIVHSPTNNCQLISVAGIQTIINGYSAASKTKQDKKEAAKYMAELLIDAVDHYGKYAVLLDVNSRFTAAIEAIVKELPDGKILTKAPYESTNGSDMVIFVIKVLHNTENDDDPYDDEYW